MSTQAQTVAHVYQAISSVMAEIAKEGIAKDRRNEQQKYSFRGIDDVYNALSPVIAKHHLCILPRVLSREKSERTTANGGVLFYVVVDVEFDMISAVDGSKHTIRTMGEAMDSGDKATNKAMSAAYKYACMQAFCIPTEGDNDADATTHAGIKPVEPPKPVAKQAKPDTPFYEMASDADARAYVTRAKSSIATFETRDDCVAWWMSADEKAKRVSSGIDADQLKELKDLIAALPVRRAA